MTTTVIPTLDAIAADPAKAPGLPSPVRAALVGKCAAVLAALAKHHRQDNVEDAQTGVKTHAREAVHSDLPTEPVASILGAGGAPESGIKWSVAIETSKSDVVLPLEMNPTPASWPRRAGTRLHDGAAGTHRVPDDHHRRDNHGRNRVRLDGRVHPQGGQESAVEVAMGSALASTQRRARRWSG